MANNEDFHKYWQRALKAFKQVDTDASHEQRESMRARVGKLHIHGLDCRIEYPPGSFRSGVSKDGKKWSRKVNGAYGRIKRTSGLDGEQLDFWLGEHPESQLVFVITQLKSDGSIDEHKAIIGTRNYKEAKNLYLSNFPKDWAEKHLGEIRGFTMKDFKEWVKTNAPIKNSSKKEASFSEYMLEIMTCQSPVM